MAEAAKKKTAVSKRIVLDADGNAQDEWLDAYGVRYEILATGKPVDFQFAEFPDEVIRGAAAVGMLTFAGNVTNAVRNSEEGKAKTNAETAEEEYAALTAWRDALLEGNWTGPRGEMEAGLATLSQAYAVVLSAAGTPMTAEDALTKLKSATKEQVKAIRAHPKVAYEVAKIITEKKAEKAEASAGEVPLL